MTQVEQQKAAAQFVSDWQNRGDEKAETHNYWIQLIRTVFGVEKAENYIEFEKRVKLNHTSFIDAYIPETKVLIEQKSLDIDLCKSYAQSDGSVLTPFEQAKRYADDMPYDEHPRWIVVCNFEEFHIHDMNTPKASPEIVKLIDLEKEYYRLQFLVDTKNENIKREEEISKQAGVLVGKLYDAIYKEYINPDQKSLRSLNILCVRLVFCLYAEDAGLFETKTSFEDYIKTFPLNTLRKAIIDLFKALDTKLEQRDKYDTSLKPFPYVNGGLFAAEDIEIPNFTTEIVNVIINHCAPFNWSEISPTIFGAVFESTLNPETRRSGGMHYTSIANIHKVIDPLFMERLNAEFDDICKTSAAKTKRDKLFDFQKKLGSLNFLDPACGSGNFLTETYLSLRRLENKVITLLHNGGNLLGFDELISVKISQFYGIEINDFAVTVAKTALWIAESQMMAETERILSKTIDFFPLTTNAFIVEGNALRMDWKTLKALDNSQLPNDGLFAGFDTPTDGTEHHYDYIMGNPPFVGARLMSDAQKKDVNDVFINTKNVGNLDYVSCWYKKTANLIKETKTKAALVSTNSITQGEQPAILWKSLMQEGIKINFAYRTFRWDSESTLKAHVHCVIVGFSSHCELPTSYNSNDACHSELTEESSKRIYLSDNQSIIANNINSYLVDAPDIFIESRNKPICDVPEIGMGNQPIDGGNYLFSKEDMEAFIKKETAAEKYFKPWYGSDEFINSRPRYCLWLGECSPKELRSMPECLKRVEAVRQLRIESKRGSTKKLADTPTRFQTENMPKGNYIVIPETSSEKRRYVPMGFLTPTELCSNALRLIPNATLYHFGILTSNVHMAWMRAVCGRLEMRYRYSKDIVYNNFPWPGSTSSPPQNTSLPDEITGSPNKKIKFSAREPIELVEVTAKAILDAREKYPECSLADLYDETTMPLELRRAHQANDKAVMQAYGFDVKMSESEIVAELFKMYEKMVENSAK